MQIRIILLIPWQKLKQQQNKCNSWATILQQQQEKGQMRVRLDLLEYDKMLETYEMQYARTGGNAAGKMQHGETRMRWSERMRRTRRENAMIKTVMARCDDKDGKDGKTAMARGPRRQDGNKAI
jgi:hypothetical protein